MQKQEKLAAYTSHIFLDLAGSKGGHPLGWVAVRRMIHFVRNIFHSCLDTRIWLPFLSNTRTNIVSAILTPSNIADQSCTPVPVGLHWQSRLIATLLPPQVMSPRHKWTFLPLHSYIKFTATYIPSLFWYLPSLPPPKAMTSKWPAQLLASLEVH